jgi:hypothetical protein
MTVHLLAARAMVLIIREERFASTKSFPNGFGHKGWSEDTTNPQNRTYCEHRTNRVHFVLIRRLNVGSFRVVARANPDHIGERDGPARVASR